MKFRIYRTEEGFRWSMHAANGKNLAWGEAYQRIGALKTMMRKNIIRDDPALEAAFQEALDNIEVYEDNPFDEE